MKNKITLLLPLPIIVAGLILCGSPAGAAGEKGKEPTVITSRSLTADNKAKTALFEGAVVAKKGDMTMSADRMLVHYADEKGGGIRRIDAEGNVKVLKGDRAVTSQAATYLTDPERIVFTGEPAATEGENVVRGSRMTFFVKDDRYTVENSKVFLKDGKATAQ